MHLIVTEKKSTNRINRAMVVGGGVYICLRRGGRPVDAPNNEREDEMNRSG